MIRNVTFHDVLIAVTSAEDADIQKNVFFWKDGKDLDLFMRQAFQSVVFKEIIQRLVSVALGDPCAQPTQLNESMLHPCTNATKLNYFDGSKAGFGIFIIVLFLFPVGQCHTHKSPPPYTARILT